MLSRFVAGLFILCISAASSAEAPSRPLASFEAAKKAARDGIYSEHHTDFYCGCAFIPNKTGSGGKIDPTACGYKPRKNKTRGRILEWEHVVPAYYFGHERVCWRKGHRKCVKSDGTAFKGRECCGRVDKGV